MKLLETGLATVVLEMASNIMFRLSYGSAIIEE
jgi:hypothetical protein